MPSSGRSCPFFPLHPSFPTDGGKMQKSGRKQEEDPRGTGRRRPGGGQGEARGRPGGGQGEARVGGRRGLCNISIF